MRLINARTLDFHDSCLLETPKYAIISHTWGDQEVTFQDMLLPSRCLKKGFAKITRTCQLALEDGLEFAWVDTCCIDKFSSAELTESIKSMFQWYLNAAVCYNLSPDASSEGALHQCRWFTRGWTLQELIAPKNIVFYDMAWKYRGSKLLFIDAISKIARIPEQSSVEKRHFIEDTGYCLLGLFEVNMPLIYSEGPKAFRRLQEEIVKRNNDLTIFAWSAPQTHGQQSLNLFATSPAAFAHSAGIVPFSDDFVKFSVTKKGLFVSGNAPLPSTIVTVNPGQSECLRYALFLGRDTHMNFGNGGLYLRKLGPKIFCRDATLPLAGFGRDDINLAGLFSVTDYYILIDPMPMTTNFASTFRNHSLHIPVHDVFTLEEAVPECLWDLSDRVFLRPKPYSWARYPMVLAMGFFGMLLGNKSQTYRPLRL